MIDSIKYKVSVIINSYNGRVFIADCIQSVLNQTYDNFEIIIWDNKSTDNTYEIINKFNDPRIKYYYSTSFDNLPTARNKAIKKSSSNFIAILDVDDKWNEDKLEKQINIFKNQPEYFLVYTNVYYYKLNSLFFKKKILTKNKLPSGKINKYIFQNYTIIHSTIMFRLDMLNNNKIYNEKYDIINDFILCEENSRSSMIYAIQEPLALIRIHNKSYSFSHIKKEIKELENYYYELKNNGLNKTYYSYLLEKILYLKVRENLIKEAFIKKILILFRFKSNNLKIKGFIYLIFPKFFSNLLKKL